MGDPKSLLAIGSTILGGISTVRQADAAGQASKQAQMELAAQQSQEEKVVAKENQVIADEAQAPQKIADRNAQEKQLDYFKPDYSKWSNGTVLAPLGGGK